MTTLFSLVPFGLGTIEVESLTSYIRRVAAAHVVSPCTLLRENLPIPNRLRRGPRILACPAGPGCGRMTAGRTRGTPRG